MRNVFEWKLNDQCEAWDNARGEWRAGWIREFTHEPMAGKSMFVVAPKTGPANDLRCVEHWIREIQVPNGAIPPLANTKLPTDAMCNRALPGAHSGCDKPKGHDGLCLTAEEHTKAKAALLDLAKVGESFIGDHPLNVPHPKKCGHTWHRNNEPHDLARACTKPVDHIGQHWDGTAMVYEDREVDHANAKPGTCKIPPPGWYCSLADGHTGPCPTWPIGHKRSGPTPHCPKCGRSHTANTCEVIISAPTSSYALKDGPFDLRIIGKCNKPMDDKRNYCLDRADHEGECGQRGSVFILSEKHALREALDEFEQAYDRIKKALRKRMEEL